MSKLIIVSNRLPVSIKKTDGKLEFKKSVGGLATALDSLSLGRVWMWIGWPGIVNEDIDIKDKGVITDELAKLNCVPIFLSKGQINKYYFGFSNKTVWPLFHYFPVYTKYDNDYWNTYLDVNRRFCDVICNVADESDDIWVQDYHLLVLPKLLRENLPSAGIGFFLHIPFPSSELFSQMPYRKTILEGLLGSDLIGFHTYDYVRHFFESIRRVLGFEHHFSQINYEDRIVLADIFPIGINYQRFNTSGSLNETKKFLNELRNKFDGFKIIISIDRLDYTKGIPNRIEAFDYFLEHNPEYIGKVVLIICAVPSRTQVDTYAKLKKRVDKLVGKVNGKYGTLNWMPVHYMFRSLVFEKLTALYNFGDVAMVTPIRDGMNLIAKEYIASRADGTGVLILSEGAGASQELGEAITVNVNDKIQMADSIKTALEMPLDAQIEANTMMQERLKSYDITRWANDFLERLTQAKLHKNILSTIYLKGELEGTLLAHYADSRSRLMLLDYDGTLIGFKSKPNAVVPDEELLDIIKRLSDDVRNSIIIISGRDRNILENWFGSLRVSLIAEHGIWLKESGGTWTLLQAASNEWKKDIKPILQLFVDRTPRSYLEEKDYSLVWHYRNVDINLVPPRVYELKNILHNFTGNLNIGILDGNKAMEIKNAGINKGTATSSLIDKSAADFILSVGDDATDEDMFGVLNGNGSAYSIRVGNEISKAKYHLKSVQEVRNLLKLLITKY